jgi:hypothetical protein
MPLTGIEASGKDRPSREYHGMTDISAAIGDDNRHSPREWDLPD